MSSKTDSTGLSRKQSQLNFIASIPFLLEKLKFEKRLKGVAYSGQRNRTNLGDLDSNSSKDKKVLSDFFSSS